VVLNHEARQKVNPAAHPHHQPNQCNITLNKSLCLRPHIKQARKDFLMSKIFTTAIVGLLFIPPFYDFCFDLIQDFAWNERTMAFASPFALLRSFLRYQYHIGLLAILWS
jgi:hypothetical protein